MGRSDLPRTITPASIARWGEISYAEAHPATSSRVLLCQRSAGTSGRRRCHDVLRPIPHTPRHSACSAAVVPTGVRSCAAVAAVGAVHVQGGVGRGGREVRTLRGASAVQCCRGPALGLRLGNAPGGDVQFSTGPSNDGPTPRYNP